MRKSSLALVILVALVFSGCLNEEKKKPAASMMQMPPPTVQTLNVTPKEIEIDYIYPSRISTVHDVSIVSKVSGTLEKKHFKQGERVKQGDLLYEIEDAKYRANYSQALANEFVAQTSL
ncbi:MAG: biotin/lipoyl-binding protein, partial [Sulfurospirillaceae bacterium]